MHKLMKKALKIAAAIIGILMLILIALVQKIDRTPYQDTTHYAAWKTWISAEKFPENTGEIQVGWSSENITPHSPGPLAGYGKRWGKHFESVHDSLYVRVITIRNPTKTIHLLSADMLIIPPNVTERLEELLQEAGISIADVHLGATHTHHGLGGWGDRLTGRLFSGKYDPEVEEELATKFRDAILKSQDDLVDAEISYAERSNEENVQYRLKVAGGEEDPDIRSLIFRRDDGKQAKLVTYAAHATVLEADSLHISRDYPGILVDSLEDQDAEFAMFMAGAVGSMGAQNEGEDGYERAENMANGILEHFRQSHTTPFQEQPTLASAYFEIPMPAQSARISIDYALRPWVFRWLFGHYPTYVKVSKIGNTLIIGMPADFSGEIMNELDDYAEAKGIDLIITSFNGGYVGYITPDKLYEQDLYESVIMSWNGYQAGTYFTEVAKDIIDKVSK